MTGISASHCFHCPSPFCTSSLYPIHPHSSFLLPVILSYSLILVLLAAVTGIFEAKRLTTHGQTSNETREWIGNMSSLTNESDTNFSEGEWGRGEGENQQEEEKEGVEYSGVGR